VAEAQTRDMRGIVHEVPLHQIGDADDAEVALSSRREAHRRTHCGQCSEPYLSGSPKPHLLQDLVRDTRLLLCDLFMIRRSRFVDRNGLEYMSNLCTHESVRR